MMKPGYSIPLTVEFLKNNDKLVLDTRFFNRLFKEKLANNIDEFDDRCSGILVHSENFQALNLIQRIYKDEIDCVYIDPPYNTGDDGFNYKDGYLQSSWVSMMTERLSLARRIMSSNSSCFCSIDDTSCPNLWKIMDNVFLRDNYAGSFVWKRRSSSGLASTPLSIDHEYILVFAKYINTIKFSGLTKTKENYPYWDEKTKKYYASTDLTIGATREQRPNQFFPITNPRTGTIFHANPHRVWRFFPETMQQIISDDLIIWPDEAEGNLQRPRYKTYFDPDVIQTKPCSSWIETASANDREIREDENDYELEILSSGMNQEGGRSLQKIVGSKIFAYPKPVSLIRSLIRASTSKKMKILDFFGGSGTTAHAVININREDNGERTFIVVEMGEHFETVIKPRITKVIYSDFWKDGKPSSRQSGISHCCKYLRLESYEDTLNNLVLKRTPEQLSLLADTPSLKEEYMLSYMMDLEAEGSASLLNVDTFADPWNYKLKIATGSAGETKTRPVDLVETFNYLLGLTVVRRIVIRGIEVVEGTNPEGEKVLVIWRNTDKVSNAQLNEFFRKQDFRPREGEFNLIYVNGDSNLENFRLPDETWKVRLTEEEFKRLMFDVEDV
jgi:adenine-specific DNA-methyltransferase